MPSIPPIPSDLLTCSAIAIRIALTRGTCNRASVWRAIQRLKIQPHVKAGSYSLYTVDNAEQIEAAMRKPKAKASEQKGE